MRATLRIDAPPHRRPARSTVGSTVGRDRGMDLAPLDPESDEVLQTKKARPMNTGIGLSLAAGFACLIGACASRPPQAQAAKTERLQCTDDPTAEDQYDLALIQSMAVIKAQPLYSFANTMYVQPEARVNGATLVVRPPPGVSAERMTRALQCHTARAELGQADASPLHVDPLSSCPASGSPSTSSTIDRALTCRDNRREQHRQWLEGPAERANTFAVNRGGRESTTGASRGRWRIQKRHVFSEPESVLQ